MLSLITIIIPVFALILVGYLIVKTAYFSSASQKGLAEFAFQLAIPVMLFRTIATAEPTGDKPITILAAYFGAVFLTWIIATAITRLVLHRPMADAAAISMSSTYGNIVMLGIPLGIAAFGPAAAAPMAVILGVNTPTLWLIGTIHIQIAAKNNDGRSIKDLVFILVRDLLRNPLIIAMLSGAVWRLTGLGLTPALDTTLATLGSAGVPCALVALGGSLTQFEIKGQMPTLTTVIFLKLAVMPLIAWGLAKYVLALSPVAIGVTTLFAAMPAGANAYLFANRYGRAANSASGAVALGTLLAAFTAAYLISVLSAVSPVP
jgi:malonate transporter and related proteins